MDFEIWKADLVDAFAYSFAYEKETPEEVFLKIGYHYQYHAPTSLFKYYPTDAEKTVKTLLNRKMWYSAPSKFNDPFDADFAVDEREIIRNFVSQKPDGIEINEGSRAWNEMKNSIKREMPQFRAELEKLRHTIGIASFSETPASILMWSHYAKNHKGICVEYDSNSFIEELKYIPVPVVYSNKKQILKELSIDGREATKNMREFLIRLLCTKSVDWAYEKEWRIIRNEAACCENLDKQKEGAKLESTQPISITLGCKADEPFSDQIESLCKEQRIDLYRMKKSNADYELRREKIGDYGLISEDESQ